MVNLRILVLLISFILASHSAYAGSWEYYFGKDRETISLLNGLSSQQRQAVSPKLLSALSTDARTMFKAAWSAWEASEEAKNLANNNREFKLYSDTRYMTLQSYANTYHRIIIEAVRVFLNEGYPDEVSEINDPERWDCSTPELQGVQGWLEGHIKSAIASIPVLDNNLYKRPPALIARPMGNPLLPPSCTTQAVDLGSLSSPSDLRSSGSKWDIGSSSSREESPVVSPRSQRGDERLSSPLRNPLLSPPGIEVSKVSSSSSREISPLVSPTSQRRELLLQDWRNLGSTALHFRLATGFYFGSRGYPKDYAKAFTYFAAAATRNHADAQCFLGIMYEFGQGTAVDKALALHWYRQAAENGSHQAQFILGKILCERQGSSHDLLAGSLWLKEAARDGNSEADLLYQRYEPFLYEECEDAERTEDTKLAEGVEEKVNAEKTPSSSPAQVFSPTAPRSESDDSFPLPRAEHIDAPVTHTPSEGSSKASSSSKTMPPPPSTQPESPEAKETSNGCSCSIM